MSEKKTPVPGDHSVMVIGLIHHGFENNRHGLNINHSCRLGFPKFAYIKASEGPFSVTRGLFSSEHSIFKMCETQISQTLLDEHSQIIFFIKCLQIRLNFFAKQIIS